MDASVRADVRANDYGRYCCALFAAPAVQPSLLAILAFDLEVGRVRLRVREAAMGQVRLLWWRDAVEQLYAGAIPRHPVAEALAGPIAQHRLTRRHFDAIVASHLTFYDGTAHDAAAVESAAVAPLLLWLEVLGAADPLAVEAVHHVGCAWMHARSAARTQAEAHLAAARALQPKVPRAALPALLPAVLAQRALKRGPEDSPGLGAPLALVRAALFGRY